MKIKTYLLIILTILVSQALRAQVTGNGVTELLLSAYSERAYSTVQVTDQQLDLILKCGIKAPSSRNGQPWKFTVIQNEPAMKEIINNVVSGNVLIIVSGLAPQQEGGNPDFDCGLAAESMFIAAHGLGLAARIYGSPAAGINEKRDAFRIPAGYNAVVVLRIGNIDKSVDAVSSATPRKSIDDIVNYVK
jgi:nitroreductase